MKTFAKILSIGMFAALVSATGAGAQYYYPEQYHNYGYGTVPNQYAYPYGYQQSYYYPYASYSAVSLSQTSLNLAAGQSATVYVQGGMQFSLSSSNWNTTWQSISGNTLTVQGINPGSTTITVCSTSGYYASNCASLYVSVGSYGSYYPYNAGYYYPYNGYYGYSLIDEETIRLDKGERETVDINMVGGRYYDAYISDNSNRRIASADIDDDELEIKGLREGTTTITVCQDGVCDSVRVIVRD